MTSVPMQESSIPTEQRPLRLAIVGGGRVTETCHLPALAKLRDRIRVVALAELDEHRRRRVAGTFEILQTFADVHSMLRDGGAIDAIAICTPAIAHAEAALAAVEAGKHLFIEKPLALALNDADRIADSIGQSGTKAVMGFNLRHHRNVLRARQMISSGVLGDIQLIRSVWTSAIRTRMRLPSWRGRRTSGGGALSEIAVHHIDLVRFLTGKAVVEVFAQSQHGESDDETVGLILRVSNGTIVSAAFTERSGDCNEMELIGSNGRLSFSVYQFDSLRFTPVGQYGGRAKELLQTLRNFPEAYSTLRRGGVFHDSYRRQWESFARVIRDGQPPLASIEDGREALRVVLAAGASANRGAPVLVCDAPREPVEVPGRSVQSAPEVVASDSPRLSAILSTRDNFDSIRLTVKYLRAQTSKEELELVIVCPTCDQLKLDEAAVSGFWGYQVVEIGRFDSVAPANAAGARAARAPIVVFCEDHSFPDPDWARNLLIAHAGPYAVVGPAVHNANPKTYSSRADFLIGYGAWAEPIKPCEPKHLPGHNSAYKREILLNYDNRLADMLEAESILHWDLVRNGHRLYLDPTARLAHTNFSKFGIWTKTQYHAGRLFSGTRSIGWPMWRRVIYTLASPLIPIVRFKRVWADARRLRGTGFVEPGVVVALIYGLVLDGLGQMMGYALGAGASKGIAHEFCRVAHITEEDRRMLNSTEPARSLPQASA